MRIRRRRKNRYNYHACIKAKFVSFLLKRYIMKKLPWLVVILALCAITEFYRYLGIQKDSPLVIGQAGVLPA